MRYQRTVGDCILPHLLPSITKVCLVVLLSIGFGLGAVDSPSNLLSNSNLSSSSDSSSQLSDQSYLAGSIQVSISDAQAEVGDLVTISIRYQRDQLWTAPQDPDPMPWFQAWQVESLRGPITSSVDGDQHIEWQFDCRLSRSGPQVLPQPRWDLHHPSYDPIELIANEVIITVAEPGEEVPEPELLGIRAVVIPPEPSLLSPSHSWWWLAVLLIPAGGIIWWLQRPQHIEAIDPAEACQQALAKAGKVQEPRAAGAALSQAVRRYIGMVENFDGIGATPKECLALSKEHLPMQQWSDLRMWFEALDALRFAPEAGSRDAIQDLASRAEAWVSDDTQRRVALAAAAAATGAES